MAIETLKTAYQHFNGTGEETIIFSRSVNTIILTTASAVTISFDDGENFMDVANGTHQFDHLHVKTLKFGNGTWSGVGVAL
jgi:hypothetical protein